MLKKPYLSFFNLNRKKSLMDKKELYEDLAKKVFSAMNSGDFEHIKEDLSEDIVLEFPGVMPVEGIRRVIIFVNALLRKYKFLTFKISDILIDNNRASVVWTNFGEYNDDTEYNNSGMTLIRFSEDKIIFLSDYFKDTSFTNS